MRFLCGRIRQRQTVLQGSVLAAQWFEWMNTGGLYYALADWKQSIPHIGCARDLMLDALAERRVTVEEGSTKLTLSSIYLGNAFERHGNVDKARGAFSLGYMQLGRALCLGEPAWIRKCMCVLVDPAQHGEFFTRYLNLPLQEQTATGQQYASMPAGATTHGARAPVANRCSTARPSV